MTITRKIVLRELKQMALLVIIGGVVGGYISCQSCFEVFGQRTIAIIALNGSFWLFFWKGNEYLSGYIETKISWLKAPVKRFWVGFVVMVVYTVSTAAIIFYLFYIVYLGNSVSEMIASGFMINLLAPVFTTMFIMSFLFAREFLISYRQAAINLEKLRTEQLASQYETLKSQVNPHFLFNSLNVLTSLVHQQPDTAVKFIKKLSEVYRFVLDSRKQEVVDLETELKFVKDYMYLQKIRFGENLNCKMEVSAGLMSKMVPPLSIQMLVENAIKHNEVSEEFPLSIDIVASGDEIVVSNSVRAKINKEPSSGAGLDNIKDRYEFLSGKKVAIVAGKDTFEVRLPLLTMAKDQ